MCELTTATLAYLAIASTVVSAGVSAYGQQQQGKTSAQIGRNNAIMAEYAAADAQKRGEKNAMDARRRAASIKGAQRSRLAAKGLDLGEGTAQELQDQTDFFGETDAATARDNANREAWSLRAGGANSRAQGEAAASQGNLAAFGTVLGAGGQVASKWSSYTGGTTGGYQSNGVLTSTGGDGLSQGDRRQMYG